MFGLCRSLVARGHAVRLVTLGEPGVEVLEGVEVVRLRALGPRRWPTATGLGRACEGADVVHVHAVDGLLDALVLGAVHPLGLSTHGGYFHTPRQRLLKELWLRTGTRAVVRHVDRVWFSSTSDRERFAPARVTGTVEPDGVDVERFQAVTRTPDAGRWLVLGRVDVHKGLDDLIATLPLLRDRVRVVEIVGPEQVAGLVGRLRGLAARHGVADRVVWRGALEGAELDEVVAHAELALQPSRYEGFGVAAVELMAARVPLVLSDIPAFRAHAGVVPLVDFRAPRAAATGVRAALQGTDTEAAARHAATYAWPARAAAWESRYLELVDRR